MYCKLQMFSPPLKIHFCINSSKVYCKCLIVDGIIGNKTVLIVAKCIVNYTVGQEFKYFDKVLIVAKCIVNPEWLSKNGKKEFVLIVAKCIVNLILRLLYLIIF